jgi:LPXTG-motif cell wall-anchored protein
MRKLRIISLFASLAILLFPAIAAAAPVTFNSLTNSPTYGNSNERYFFRAKNADSSSGGFTNGTVTVDSGNAVLMQAYINNNTSATIENVKLTITLPTASSTSQTVTAVISASNSNPSSISDTVTFAGTTAFTMSFDSNASVNITRGSTITSSNASISGNVLTADLGNLAGPNDRVLVTARALVNNQQTTTNTTTSTPSTTTSTNTNPVLACGTLTLGSDNRTLTLTNPTATNATIASYTFTTRNSAGGTVHTVTNPVSAQNANVYTFTQTTPDTYTVSAVVNTDKGSTAANACTHQFIVQAPVTLSASTTTTTPTATKLPNTGAGDTVAIFVTAVALASGGHYILFRRRQI